ncbi:Uncharacterized protein FWK35_00002738 [Aphis craccivora]|uniref:Uncharacterized protein n=1 Tax=Aphis craccivora TaxID=307492 RepID=A0A6G0YWM5_APHCR|nr:Uncharacterized protein FWK35_00002738 [Aphis craccivora]
MVKLNQHVVENVFSYIKGMTGSANIIILCIGLCYVLGKHSNVVFTENKNTEDGTDVSFLNIHECLTGEPILLINFKKWIMTWLKLNPFLEQAIFKLQTLIGRPYA